MNEPAMLTTLPNNRGEILPKKEDYDSKYNRYDFIPYVPGYNENRPSIEAHTMSINALSRQYEKNNLLVSYNFKPLMAFMQGKYTNEFLQNNLNKRAFVLSRSTTLGAGKKVFHWLGDNNSNYRDMKNGLDGIYQFQIYGIPMTGDDICGFGGQSNDNMCAKWMSIGAFFPFMRNHNSINMEAHDPFAYGTNSHTYKMSKKALYLRYSLLRYIYSEMFLISLGKSGSFFKPLFFEFSDDIETYKYTNEAAMFGNALYTIPCLTEDDKMKGYFPNTDWMEFSKRKIFKTYDSSKTKGDLEEFTFDYENIQLYMRGGYIIPHQDISNKVILNTHWLHNNPTDIIIQPHSVTHIATGNIVFDDDSKDTLENKNYYLIHLNFNFNNLLFSLDNSGDYNEKDFVINKIKFCRMNYLTKEKQNIYAKITDTKGKVFNQDITLIDEENFDVDLSSYGFTFSTIKSISLEEHKVKINHRKKMKFLGDQ